MLSKGHRRSHVAPETGEVGHRRIVDGSGRRIPCCGRQTWEKRCRWALLSQLSHPPAGKTGRTRSQTPLPNLETDVVYLRYTRPQRATRANGGSGFKAWTERQFAHGGGSG